MEHQSQFIVIVEEKLEWIFEVVIVIVEEKAEWGLIFSGAAAPLAPAGSHVSYCSCLGGASGAFARKTHTTISLSFCFETANIFFRNTFQPQQLNLFSILDLLHHTALLILRFSVETLAPSIWTYVFLKLQ